MKGRILIIPLLLFGGINALNAQTNLLSGIFNYSEGGENSPETFYSSKWKLYDGNGTLVSSENWENCPWSCFGKIENFEVSYNSVKLFIGEPQTGLENGEPVVLLKFANEESIPQNEDEVRFAKEYYHYVYPLDASVSGECTVSGCCGRYKLNNESFPDVKPSVMNGNKVMVMAFSKEPLGKVTISLEDGSDIIVKDSQGNMIPSLWKSLPDLKDTSKTPKISFSKDFEMPEGTAYINVYGPGCVVLLSNLKFEAAVETGLNCVESDSSEEIWYDINGSRVSAQEDALSPGLYIRKTGSKCEKILKR